MLLKFKCKFVIFFITTLFIYSVTSDSNSGQFPSYIEKCRKSDPNIGNCIINSAKKALLDIIKGDPNIKTPSILGLNPNDQEFKIGDNFQFMLKNIKASSAPLNPLYASMDFEKESFMLGLSMDFLTWIADFEAKGKLTDREIHETGRINITFNELQLNYTKHLHIQEINGINYYQIKKSETVAKMKKTLIKTLEQTSVGESLTEKEKNKFEKLKHKKLEPALKNRLTEICSELVTYVMNLVLKTTSKDELFLP